VLDEAGPRTWLVRRDDDAPIEAVVEAFARGYKLSSWSLIESERVALGVYTSKEQAETAWWRHLDRDNRH
jgi:hypothetical protein